MDSRNDKTSPFLIGASVGGAVCLGLCGLYVLYRRRSRYKNNKVAATKKIANTPLAIIPPHVVIVSLVDARECSVRASSIDVSRSCNSSVSSSSLNISSLHTSEQSEEELASEYENDANSDNSDDSENRKPTEIIVHSHRVENNSSVYSGSSNNSHMRG